ncbi:hypothetical protein P7C73_g4466, partial [Tremellales sp. Uapishka_1]
MPPGGEATPRIPYAASTPPTTPLRLTSPAPPHRSSPGYFGTPHYRNEYPESPSSPIRRLRSGSPPKIPKFTLPSPGSKYRLPRFWKSPRRILSCLLVLGAFLGVIRLVLFGKDGFGFDGEFRVGDLIWSKEKPQGDGLCRFVSPVEAYQRDLKRLRGIHPSAHHYDPLLTNISRSHHSFNSHQHHKYSPTGHLLVSSSPDAAHPIPLLLSLGEKRWEELLSRQSRTLGEAVREYTQRYGRRPPKGFDVWWEFAMLHDLVLPDEYDRINLDLAPFWALPKAEMKKRLEMVEEMAETFTIVVQDGIVDYEIKDEAGLKWGGTLLRAVDATSLIKAFSRFLPDLRATFSIFDQPQIYLSWARRSSLVDLGLRGEHTTHLKESDDAHVRLSRSCAPDSNFRKNASFHGGKSFIYDGLEASDLCQNPYLVPLHGLTLEPHTPESHPRPHTQLLPLFSLAKTSINSDILITPLDQFRDPPGKDPKWEDKSSSKLVWRGSPTGISMMSENLPWRSAHRVRLHHFANDQSSKPISFLVPELGQSDQEEEEEVNEEEQNRVHYDEGSVPLRSRREELDTSSANDFFFDMKLAGAPLQCLETDGTCDAMRREIEWAGHQSSEEMNKHKFLLDIDGNGWSGRFRRLACPEVVDDGEMTDSSTHRLMSTNSVVIKTGIFTEWFQPHLIPWFMYIPAKLDFSDLADILAFFRGTPKHPDLGFDETAKALARNGQCFVQRMFRIEDLQAYMMRLFLEYARITAEEGEDMDFYYEEEVDEESTPAEGDEPVGIEDISLDVAPLADVTGQVAWEGIVKYGEDEFMGNDAY